MRVNSLILLIFIIVGATGMAQNDGSVYRCLSPLHKLAHPKYESAVELEMISDPAIMNLITSQTGTVRGILNDGLVPPEIKGHFPGLSDSEILKTPWKELAPYKALAILNYDAKRKGTSFTQDRKIPKVRYESAVFANVHEETDFLGKTYPPGLHTIRPPEFLKGAIEYMGPFNYPGGIELHFRIQKPAGEVSVEARKLQQLLGVKPTHQHVYVVSPIPQKKLEKNPELVATQNADFYRRVNLAAEMISVVEEEGRIAEKYKGSGADRIDIFGSLRPRNLVAVADYLVARGQKQELRLGDQAKMAWVGFRGHDKFDKPDLMGMEIRSIAPHSDLKVYERFLNTIQKSWMQQKTGISQTALKHWLDLYEGDYSKALTENWYQKSWYEVIRQSPSEVRKELGVKRLWNLSFNRDEKHQELKMLFHNWAKDPLFFESPEQQKQIIASQIKAIQTLKKNPESITETVSVFLKKSGIYESVLKSLNPQ
ncbi:MAG: hypothetical protein EB078_04040 [Proteobacteria bacterium]|nr:hypothetical protein [Pseudomonadota bacterium]NDC24411.1 hypothetical protein [Pseudomonadota bacterium]NDD04054.1 hypothetical protein [Pseudomonadota bacterium]NDG26163.1 hypothetical protein [Pseudomonadota bacterium]